MLESAHLSQQVGEGVLVQLEVREDPFGRECRTNHHLEEERRVELGLLAVCVEESCAQSSVLSQCLSGLKCA